MGVASRAPLDEACGKALRSSFSQRADCEMGHSDGFGGSSVAKISPCGVVDSAKNSEIGSQDCLEGVGGDDRAVKYFSFLSSYLSISEEEEEEGLGEGGRDAHWEI